MKSTYKTIAFKNLSDSCGLVSARSQPANLDVNAPASSLLVDFTKTHAITVGESVSVNDALDIMKTNGIRSLMVMSSQGDFVGVVTAMDLMGRKPMAYAHEAGVSPVEVQVKHIMIAKSKLRAIDRADVGAATLDDILQLFKSFGEQHILVVGGDNDNMQISGMFSATDFRRSLGVSLDNGYLAQTFSDIERVINERKEVM